MKVFYPGPEAAHFPRASYFIAWRVQIVPGVNDLPTTTAKEMLDAGLVSPLEEAKPIEAESLIDARELEPQLVSVGFEPKLEYEPTSIYRGDTIAEGDAPKPSKKKTKTTRRKRSTAKKTPGGQGG